MRLDSHCNRTFCVKNLVSTEKVVKILNDFLETAEGRPVSVNFEAEGFYRRNDAGTLPGNCAEFIFLIDE